MTAWPGSDRDLARALLLGATMAMAWQGCASRGGAVASSPPVSAPSSAATSADPLPLSPAAAAAVRAPGPPEWRPGNRWSYGWTSGKETGTRTVEVVETREIAGTSYYVVRVGELDHLYTADLHWAGSVFGDRVESRISPPHPWFEWPLEVGRRWTQRGTYEERGTKRQYTDTFSVVAAEAVDVPAGHFNALKVTRQSSEGDSDEYWYASEVGFHVRWVGRRASTQFEERLQSYRVGANATGASSPPSRPR